MYPASLFPAFCSLNGIEVVSPGCRLSTSNGAVEDRWTPYCSVIARSAVIHDELYSKIREYRESNGYHVGSGGSSETEESKKLSKQCKRIADKVFLEAMKESDPKVATWKAYASYYSVVLFGRWSIIPRETD